MRISCPNTKLKYWKDLVQKVGENQAYFLWAKYDGNIPQYIIDSTKKDVIKKKEQVRKDVSKLEVESDVELDADTLESMYIWKELLGYPIKTISNKKVDFVDVNDAVINPFQKVTSAGIKIKSNDSLTISKNEEYVTPTELTTREQILKGYFKPNRIKTDYVIIEDNLLVTENNPNQFISTIDNNYEKVFQQDTTSIYQEINGLDKTFPEVKISKYLNTNETQEFLIKSKLSEKENKEITKKHFNC